MAIDGIVIDWVTVGAALLAGVLGGAHCAAMCGGIATSLGSSAGRSHALARAFEANGGRIAGYMLAGALVGGLGHGLLGIARMHWLATTLRVGVGLATIAVALRLLDRGRRLGFLSAPGVGAWRWLRPLQQRLWPANTPMRRIALGMLWGWLPCGLSTTVLTIAWLQASAFHGALTMAAFGLGTLPVMLPLAWSGARLAGWLHDTRRRVAASTLLMLAGTLTALSPWLMHVPLLHGLLGSLGCVASTA